MRGVGWGGALNIAGMVPRGYTKGCSIEVWLYKYTFGRVIAPRSFVQIGRVL